MTDFDPTSTAAPAGAQRQRPLLENASLAARAVELLGTHSSLGELSAADARVVVAKMGLINLPRGTTIYEEGNQQDTDQMLLVLTGEVSVEMADLGKPDAVTVSVLGAGNMLGEMGMLDGGARSATCKAVSDVSAATLSRESLKRLIEEHPKVAALLLVAIAQRLADRLRGLGDQLKLYARLGLTHFEPTGRITRK